MTMSDLLNMTFAGIGVDRWLLAFAYIAGGFLVGMAAKWLCGGLSRAVFARSKTRLHGIVLASIEKPLVFVLVFVGLGQGVATMPLSASLSHGFAKISTILVAGAVAFALSRLFDGILAEYLVPYVAKTEGTLDDQLLPILRKILKIAIWLLFTLFAIREAGYDIGALLAGLGIGGVAIALAAKDTLSNFFGSVAIFVDKPFMINDRIKVSGYDGFVSEIGLRTSRLRTLDNHLVTLPNSVFTAGAIENVSAEPSTRISTVIQLDTGIGHEGVGQALALLKDIGDHGQGLVPGAVSALTAFGESSFDVTFVYFIDKKADYFATVSATNLEVLRRLEEAGLPLAFPTRVLIQRGEESAGKKPEGAA